MRNEKTIKEVFVECKEEITSHITNFTGATERTEKITGIKFSELSDKTDTEIGNWMQTYWEQLPDAPQIHCKGFGTICNIAEEYCFGPDEFD